MIRRKNFEFYFVIFLLIFAACFFIYNHKSSESRGVKHYSQALKLYKSGDFENAYTEFGKVPSGSSLKHPALFRQARCATNLDKDDYAIKKYKKIIHSHSKSSIIPISEYNMAYLLFENKKRDAKKHYKRIIKKYPQSDYAIASEYYLGLIEMQNPPKNKKRLNKTKEKALVHFKTYLEKSPDGRFSLNSIDKIIELDTTLNNFDNLLIAKGYYANGEYEKSKKFLNKTTLAESWTDFARTEYKLGNKSKGNEYVQNWLTKNPNAVNQKELYEIIDMYIAAAQNRKEGISKLLGLNLKSAGADYVQYLNCKEVAAPQERDTCYKDLYKQYPNGQFSADVLYNIFLDKYLQKKYYDAQRLGLLHLKKFPNVKSSPAVTYYMAKIAYKLKHYESADNYFKKVINQYPDSYYAFRAYYNLHKDDGFLPFLEINSKPVVFPYRKSLDNNLVVKLAYLKDYDLVEEFCKNDKFIQSWIAHEKGNYTISAVLARKAMEELYPKPDFQDLRWRLVYPLHYYDLVTKLKGDNNPIILESIIKEESHFNPYAKSSVGAEGLMQLMPATYKEVLNNKSIPANFSYEAKNIAAGSVYYAGLLRALSNKDLYAISAYNGGIGSVRNWYANIKYNDTDEFVEQIPYPETKNYVKKVLRTYWMYGNIY